MDLAKKCLIENHINVTTFQFTMFQRKPTKSHSKRCRHTKSLWVGKTAFNCCLAISSWLRPTLVTFFNITFAADGKLKKAEEFLIAAYWNFLKFSKPEDKKEGDHEKSKLSVDEITDDEFLSYRGTLHKTFSKLFLAQKDYTKALDELKNGVTHEVTYLLIDLHGQHEIWARAHHHESELLSDGDDISSEETAIGS